ncbi:MAG TPA: DCC1-like thiol-disulfide oxidoreductase family protein [Vicinamibacteria bacterium]
MNPRLVVLFDGVCVLCDSSMRFLLEADRDGRLSFAPLQGETAREVLARHPEVTGGLSTVLYVRDFRSPGETVFARSDAVASILRDLGGGYRWLALFRFLPRFLRHALYDWVAARRYRWFGKLDACRLPRKGEEERFLP